MTVEEFFERVPEGYKQIGRFSEYSGFDEATLNFLDGITRFYQARERGEDLSNCFEISDPKPGISLRPVVDIDFISISYGFDAPVDGMIVVKEVDA